MNSEVVGTLGPILNHLSAFSFDPIPLSSIVLSSIAYVFLFRKRITLKSLPHFGWMRLASFLAGNLITFISVESVIGVYDDVLFVDHMIQHLLLVMVAGSLYAMSAPLDLLSTATSGKLNIVINRALDSNVAQVVGHPLFGFISYAILIPVTHLTSLYNLTLEYQFLHEGEHIAFIVVGYLFWRPVVGIESSKHPLYPGVRLLYLMLAVPIDTFTGVVLNSATYEMFSYYLTFKRSWGPSRIQDLQAGGVAMWLGGDSLMAFAMIPVIKNWITTDEKRQIQIDADLDEIEARNPEGSSPS